MVNIYILHVKIEGLTFTNTVVKHARTIQFEQKWDSMQTFCIAWTAHVLCQVLIAGVSRPKWISWEIDGQCTPEMEGSQHQCLLDLWDKIFLSINNNNDLVKNMIILYYPKLNICWLELNFKIQKKIQHKQTQHKTHI